MKRVPVHRFQKKAEIIHVPITSFKPKGLPLTIASIISKPRYRLTLAALDKTEFQNGQFTFRRPEGVTVDELLSENQGRFQVVFRDPMVAAFNKKYSPVVKEVKFTAEQLNQARVEGTDQFDLSPIINEFVANTVKQGIEQLTAKGGEQAPQQGNVPAEQGQNASYTGTGYLKDIGSAGQLKQFMTAHPNDYPPEFDEIYEKLEELDGNPNAAKDKNAKAQLVAPALNFINSKRAETFDAWKVASEDYCNPNSGNYAPTFFFVIFNNHMKESVKDSQAAGIDPSPFNKGAADKVLKKTKAQIDTWAKKLAEIKQREEGAGGTSPDGQPQAKQSVFDPETGEDLSKQYKDVMKQLKGKMPPEQRQPLIEQAKQIKAKMDQIMGGGGAQDEQIRRQKEALDTELTKAFDVYERYKETSSGVFWNKLNMFVGNWFKCTSKREDPQNWPVNAWNLRALIQSNSGDKRCLGWPQAETDDEARDRFLSGDESAVSSINSGYTKDKDIFCLIIGRKPTVVFTWNPSSKSVTETKDKDNQANADNMRYWDELVQVFTALGIWDAQKENLRSDIRTDDCWTVIVNAYKENKYLADPNSEQGQAKIKELESENPFSAWNKLTNKNKKIPEYVQAYIRGCTAAIQKDISNVEKIDEKFKKGDSPVAKEMNQAIMQGLTAAIQKDPFSYKANMIQSSDYYKRQLRPVFCEIWKKFFLKHPLAFGYFVGWYGSEEIQNWGGEFDDLKKAAIQGWKNFLKKYPQYHSDVPVNEEMADPCTDMRSELSREIADAERRVNGLADVGPDDYEMPAGPNGAPAQRDAFQSSTLEDVPMDNGQPEAPRGPVAFNMRNILHLSASQIVSLVKRSNFRM